ncbi:hypothetical protein [Flavobacterium sp. WC2429]|uniref:Uncharacterized protein n=1 Tax=Flavobacterium sp. WC2429 TaxID=3234140 RepID=A0AB39WLE6_9FLAO
MTSNKKTLLFRIAFYENKVVNSSLALALMGAASPDLEKQGFFQAVVFIYREYSGQQEKAPKNK